MFTIGENRVSDDGLFALGARFSVIIFFRLFVGVGVWVFYAPLPARVTPSLEFVMLLARHQHLCTRLRPVRACSRAMVKGNGQARGRSMVNSCGRRGQGHGVFATQLRVKQQTGSDKLS